MMLNDCSKNKRITRNSENNSAVSKNLSFFTFTILPPQKLKIIPIFFGNAYLQSLSEGKPFFLLDASKTGLTFVVEFSLKIPLCEYIADDIIRHYENGNQTKYVGIFRLNKSSKCRRLEITVCPEVEHACAIMSLTGTSYFNRAIRQWAARKEMLLDEHSLQIRLLDIVGLLN
ncbi:DNA polymerase lambda [Trichonephila clavipes]|nr:DNA polymerase lambda [Trichonephila clavipes]